MSSKTVWDELGKNPSTWDSHLTKKLKKEIQSNSSQFRSVIHDCFGTGKISGKPVGRLCIELLEISQEKMDASFESLAESLIYYFITLVASHFEKEYGNNSPIPNICSDMPLDKINQRGLSRRTLIMHLLAINPLNRINSRSWYAPYANLCRYMCDVTKEALEKSADPALQDVHGRTTLHLTVASLNVEVCSMLINITNDLYITDLEGATPFHYILPIDIGKSRKALKTKTGSERSPSGRRLNDHTVDICRMFRDKKFNLSIKDHMGRTLLHRAIRCDYHLCGFLLRNDCDKDSTDMYGQTPLHIGCIVRVSSNVKLFKSSGSSIYIKDLFGNTPFQYACISGVRLDCISNDLSEDCLLTNSSGWNSLHLAAYFGNVNTGQELVRSMGDAKKRALLINCPIKESGKTALMIACERGFKAFCSMLVLCTALDKQAKDRLERSALDWAFEFEQVEIAEMLFDEGFAEDLNELSRLRLIQCTMLSNEAIQRKLFDLLRKKWVGWGGVLKIALDNNYKDVADYLHQAHRAYDLDVSSN